MIPGKICDGEQIPEATDMSLGLVWFQGGSSGRQDTDEACDGAVIVSNATHGHQGNWELFLLEQLHNLSAQSIGRILGGGVLVPGVEGESSRHEGTKTEGGWRQGIGNS